MSENVTLPALGESVTEGTVTRWLKKVGDTVAIDEPLVEVSTDKVDTEIPSPVAGVVEQILVQEDETVAVGSVLAVVGTGSGVSTAPTTPAQQVEPAPAPVVEPIAPAPIVPAYVAPVAPVPVAPVIPAAPTPVYVAQTEPTSAQAVNISTHESSDSSYVTPLVRKLAQDSGVNLESVRGTGVGGRIRKEDILAASGTPNTQAFSAAAPAPKAFVADPISNLRGTVEPFSRLRKVLAERAVASMQQTAQLTSVVEVDVTRVAQLRSKVQGRFTEATGTKLNFMPFFALAAAEALQSHPKLNATVDGENIVYHGSENISFAVDTEKGLLTPVIRDAATRSIADLAKQIADLANRTRNNQLKPDELSGGTFTLTNTGSRGALFDTPVVFLPQSAILGTGIVTKRPVVVTDELGNDTIAIRHMVYLALSYDHRIIDGADASRFLVAVKNRIENSDFETSLGI